MTTPLTARATDLATLHGILQQQHVAKYDVVAGPGAIHSRDGRIVIAADEPILGPDGVTTEVTLDPLDVFLGGAASRLDVPIKYLRRMRDAGDPEATALLDANLNHWLSRPGAGPWLVRGFLPPGESTGVARAFLSNKHGGLDNLDVLMAAMDGIRESGVRVEARSCDLSEKRMRVRMEAPEIQAMAPHFLSSYRSPFDGRSGADLPVITGGIAVDNSETGNGATNIYPFLTVQVCKNGMTRTEGAWRKVHLGARMDEGRVNWSDDTKRKNVELIAAQARDAVSAFLTPEFVEGVVAEIEEKSGAPVTDPQGTLTRVSKELAFTAEESALILADFISGADPTAGGVMNAVTSAAQRVTDPERAAVLEDSAFEALTLAAAG